MFPRGENQFHLSLSLSLCLHLSPSASLLSCQLESRSSGRGMDQSLLSSDEMVKWSNLSNIANAVVLAQLQVEKKHIHTELLILTDMVFKLFFSSSDKIQSGLWTGDGFEAMF